MVSIRKVVGFVVTGLALMACSGGSPAPAPSPIEEKTLLSRSCGQEGDFMIVAWTSNDAKSCADQVTMNGIPVHGTYTYNADDRRWSMSFLVPAGETTGEVRLACAGDDIKLGAFLSPCPSTPPSGNRFETLAGDLKITGCDDSDGFVTLGGFTDDTFVMSGLGDNGKITFHVSGDTATADGVVQYGVPGHTVKLRITDGQIHMTASSPAGTCDATLQPATAHQ
jgi:hypothetical protein